VSAIFAFLFLSPPKLTSGAVHNDKISIRFPQNGKSGIVAIFLCSVLGGIIAISLEGLSFKSISNPTVVTVVFVH
jgi:hypothetical protein